MPLLQDVEALRLRIIELESQLASVFDSYESLLDERNNVCRKQETLIIAVLNYMDSAREQELDALKMLLNAAMLG